MLARVALIAMVGAASACTASTAPSDVPFRDNEHPSFPPDKGDAGPSFSPPDFGPTVQAEKAPAPLSGGTLAISSDDTLAIASDPDRDAVFLVDLASKDVTSVALTANDEPGRIAEDGAKRAHVVLRRGGAIATIDLTTKRLLERRAVCAAPRGIAYDARTNVLHVACAGGELVTLPAATGAATRTVTIERDLRDVLLVGDHLYVTTFRSAKLIEVGADGVTKSTRVPADARSSVDKLGQFKPHVAWRTLAAPGGKVLMLHQRSRTTPISTSSGGYASGGKCSPGVVQATTSTFDTEGNTPTPTAPIMAGVLAVDAAFSPDGTQVAIVSAGNAKLAVPQLITASTSMLVAPVDDCVFDNGAVTRPTGELVAVAWTKTSVLVHQSREPAQLAIGGAVVPLSTASRADTGHAIFHANAGGGIACASCHPEGGDDAHVWTFEGIGPRRTQTFRGGVTGSEPLHWDGDMTNIPMIMNHVFVGRMSGTPLNTEQINVLTRWVDAIPTIPNSAAADPVAVARGATLFADTNVGCSGCHSGAKLTNNATVAVGTGKAFQVPSLRGIGWRAPFMHDGCAVTLLDRFGACGGGDMHGKTSTLSETQKKDLVAYLETL